MINKDYGYHLGMPDLERFGWFAEMEYLHGVRYNKPVNAPQIRDEKGRQMYPGGIKWKTEGLQDCYFERNFKRIFEGEALDKTSKLERKARKEAAKLNITPVGIRPQKYPEQSSTPGDFYGTFSGRIDAMDPKKKKDLKKPQQYPTRGMFTNPAKKGGYGYLDITIGKYPEWKACKYEEKKKAGPPKQTKPPFKSGWPPRLFDANPNTFGNRQQSDYNKVRDVPWTRSGVFYPPKPAIKQGGMMAGGFSKWPEYMESRYIDPWKIKMYGPKGKRDEAKEKSVVVAQPFKPQQRNKTGPTMSVLANKINVCTNVKTYQKMKPLTYNREFIGLEE